MQSAMTSRETRLYFIPSVPIAMPSRDRRRAEDLGVAAGGLDAFDGRVGELLQARVARRDGRVAVGDADHRLLEVAFLVAEGVVHRPVRRALDAFGDVPGAAVDWHGAGRPERVEGSHGSAARSRRSGRRRGPRYHRRMLVHPQFDPIALDLSKIGIPIAVHWYGITYLVGFGLFLFLAARRARLPQFESRGWTRRDVEDLLFYGVLGTVIGGRLGYVLFYKPGFYAANPLEILAVWKGGMAFHGGLLGVIAAMALFARSRKRAFLEVTDLVAPCVPTGFAAGPDRQLHQRRAVGPLRRPEPALGDGLPAVEFPAAAPPVAALPVPARGDAPLRRPVGLRARSRAASARCRACSSPATASCASSPSSSASPTASSACSRST